ncbi:hypothetical protein D3C80_1489590 [compost metagenome]
MAGELVLLAELRQLLLSLARDVSQVSQFGFAIRDPPVGFALEFVGQVGRAVHCFGDVIGDQAVLDALGTRGRPILVTPPVAFQLLADGFLWPGQAGRFGRRGTG